MPAGGVKLKRVMLSVSDLGRSASFYRDTLGFRVTGSAEKEFVFFDTGSDVELDLRSTPHPIATGSVEVSLEADDVFARFDELGKKGVVFSQPPRPVTGDVRAQLYATDFKDPDGHVLSLTGWVMKQEKGD